MSNYQDIHSKFLETLDECRNTSIKYSGIPAPTSKHYYASLLFTKLCVSSKSLYSLCPEQSNSSESQHWDCSSVVTLARSIIETYLVFFYFCVEQCDIDEWNARWRLMNLHDHMSRLKMFNVMEGGEDQVEMFERFTPEVKADLESCVFFQSLDERKRKHFLKGNTAFFKSQDEIVESAGLSVKKFRLQYRFLSNQTHSYPMGFYRMVDSNRGMGLETETEVGYTAQTLSWLSEYIIKANTEMHDLWQGHSELIAV